MILVLRDSPDFKIKFYQMQSKCSPNFFEQCSFYSVTKS